MCDHKQAVCTHSTTPKDEGRFREEYECPCGATGVITGREQAHPSDWERTGRVFNERD